MKRIPTRLSDALFVIAACAVVYGAINLWIYVRSAMCELWPCLDVF